MPSRTEVTLLIAFVDLAGFARQAAQLDDREIAAGLDDYYRVVGERVAAAGGRVVKCIGDGVLITFAEDALERGVEALLALAPAIDAAAAARGWACRATVKAHVGPVIAGAFGAPGDERWDVIGKAVNDTARLTMRGFAVSDALRARLPAALAARIAAV